MLRRCKVRPAVLLGFILSLVLAIHYFLIPKQGHLINISADRVMDALENIVTKNNVSEKTHFLSPVAEDMFRLYDGVDTFVLFIGYPRSSHSLVGAILDAHPEIIIPHEYDLLQKWERFQSAKARENNLQKYFLYYELHKLSTKQATFGIRAKNPLFMGGSYNYHVPGLWQGGYHNKIKVIGDKKGGRTSEILSDNSAKMSILEEISNVVQVPMKFIHVTRNPFDNIATIMLTSLGARKKVRGEEAKKVNNEKRLNWAIDVYFRLAAANQRVRERYGNAVIDIPGHETVLRPKDTLQKLCDHLGVTCSEDYLEKCGKIMYSTPSVTRDKIIWTDEQKSRITAMMKNYPFLKDFSFNEYPH